MQIEKENSNKTKIYNKHANKKSKTQIKKKNESNQKKAKGRSSGKPPRLVFSIQMLDTDADAIQMLARLARLRLLRHALPISLLILRKTRLFCSLRTEVRRLTEHYFHRGFQN